MENTKKVAWSDSEEWKRCWVLLQTDPLLGLDMLEMRGNPRYSPSACGVYRSLLRCLKELTSSHPHQSSHGARRSASPRISMVVTRCVNQLIDIQNDGKLQMCQCYCKVN